MNDRIRRILIFIVIVGAGTLLIFFDLPLLLILPLIVIIGLILLILLGAIPVAELRGILASPFRKKGSEKTAASVTSKTVQKQTAAPAVPEKKRFGGLSSLFKKKPKAEPVFSGAVAKKPVAGTEQKKSGFDIRSWFRKKPSGTSIAAAPAQKQPVAAPVKKGGISLHIGSLVSSFKTFGNILRTKKDADPDKMRKIDSMLDQAVHDKPDKVEIPVMKSLSEKPFTGGGAGAIGGAGSVSPGTPDTAEEDPFLALSEDEFDTSLLDGLDEDDGLAKAAAPPAPEGPSPVVTFTLQEEDAIPAMQESEMPEPPKSVDEAPLSPELAAAAEDILKANEPESGELLALEGLEAVDENLGDLDNLNLDSMDLGEDEEEEEDVKDFGQPAPAPSVPMPEPAPVSVPAAAAGSGPKGSDQSEMAAFAAASSGDDDLISSLTSEIKTVKKDQDLSLLRDLKDFRAPGTAIEAELTELYGTLNAAAEKQKKIRGRSGATKSQAK